jgi:hypothetical protein
VHWVSYAALSVSTRDETHKLSVKVMRLNYLDLA